MQHPNTVAAIVTLALANLALYIAHRIGYVHLSQTDALNLAGALIAGVLFVGRRGLRFVFVGLWTGIWRGSEKPSADAAGLAGAERPGE